MKRRWDLPETDAEEIRRAKRLLDEEEAAGGFPGCTGVRVGRTPKQGDGKLNAPPATDDRNRSVLVPSIPILRPQRWRTLGPGSRQRLGLPSEKRAA